MSKRRALTIKLDEPQWLALASLADREYGDQLSVSELAAQWVRERMGDLVDVFAAPKWPAASDLEDPSDQARLRFLPADVPAVFVADAAAAGTFFQSDSPLFRAVREACVAVHGALPNGDGFRSWFRDQEFWLWAVPVASGPGRRGRPRRDASDERTLRLARWLRESRPDTIYAIGPAIEPVVRRAASLARLPDADVFVLPNPLGPARGRFVEEMARWLGTHYPGASAGPNPANTHRLSLDEAVTAVLTSADGPMSSREIANEIARRDLHRRADQRHPPASQIGALARRRPETYAVDQAGIGLRESER